MPKISVIVPIYNVEEYLPRCIDSILAQTFTDFELWLVDDGSPDKCGEICDAYAKKDSRIRVIHKENGGLSDARNAALDKITGEYISFIDSDDWVSPNFLENMLISMERHNAELVICNFVAAYEDGKKEIMYQPATSEMVLSGDAVFCEVLQPSACNKMYKAEIFNSIRYPKGRLYEDAYVYPDVLSQVKTLVLTGQDDYFYFKRSDSIMRSSYNLRSTHLVDAVRTSSSKLEALGQASAASIMREFVYTQTAVAFAQLNLKNPEHKKRLSEIKKIYDESYPKLMSSATSIKQKLRYSLLKISPKLHTAVFGKKMKPLT